MRNSTANESSAPKKRILVADDEASVRELLGLVLEAQGHLVTFAASGNEARARLADGAESVDLVIQDLKMPEGDGIELLRWIKSRTPEIPVIVITAFSSWDSAVEAMRIGAYDYVRKPFDTDLIRSVVTRALETPRTSSNGQKDESRGLEMIGNNCLVQAVFRLIQLIAPTDSTVLIQGESGTGKEIVARSIHQRSHRHDKPFIPVNCSAFTESLLESELFGHVRGAFTGAIENKQGLFRAASGGTLFLDEVADMSLTTQVRILRVLEDRKINPVGSTEVHPIDVRIIAATNKQMEEAVRERTFREDLYYRLNVIPLFLPPLRDRKDDIPLLAGHFLAKYSRQMKKNVTKISDAARHTLLEYDWPGNVRELENIIQRHVALCECDTIDSVTIHVRPRSSPAADSVACEPPEQLASLAAARPAIPADGINLERELEAYERKCLKEALTLTGGNLTAAAKLLGMTYRSIRYRVKKLRVKETVS
ncbi:MAG TPA: sigma-54 dependent transcriptional regulator [Planctomycetota bacterium]|nr:sigma-54 dependent transcriptional regulator [Planctomycetota bacterium]